MTETRRPRPLVAEAADAAELRELLAVVLDALEMTSVAAVADRAERARVTTAVVSYVRSTLREVVNGLPEYSSPRVRARILRDLLAQDFPRMHAAYKESVTVPAGQGVSEGDVDEHQAHDVPVQEFRSDADSPTRTETGS